MHEATHRANASGHAAGPPPDARTRVHVIAGALGAGKTTVLNALMRDRPADERWAILVNEWGQIGVDAALLRGTARGPGLELREVAGGCICCTAGLIFDLSLIFLLQSRPHRLFIEPTGLASLRELVHALSRPGVAEHVELAPIIAVVDASAGAHDALESVALEQVHAAELIIAARCDQISATALDDFYAWVARLPGKARPVIEGRHGKLSASPIEGTPLDRPPPANSDAPSKLRTLPTPRAAPIARSPLRAQPTSPRPRVSEARPLVSVSHEGAPASSRGWLAWPTLCFDADRLHAWIESCAGERLARRIKAVVHTSVGWRRYNVVGTEISWGPIEAARESRIEVIWKAKVRAVGSEHGDASDPLERALMDCLTDAAP